MTIEEFIESAGYPVSVEEARGRSRREKVAVAREAYWYFLSRHGLGCRRIARMDGRAKETIQSGLRTVKNLIETDHPLIKPYREIIMNYEL